MGFSCGIVGLPNVGKTTLFNALTSSKALALNYPFCTVEPNHGVVAVPDDRLHNVAAMFHPEKITPTTLEFVDIAGLVKGASQGEGLGNQFLSHIQTVDAVAHVVRCFGQDSISHVFNHIDPIRDLEVVEYELILKDLEIVQKRIEKQRKVAISGDKNAHWELGMLEKIESVLASGIPIIQEKFPASDLKRLSLTVALLTSKPRFVIGNIIDSQLGSESDSSLMQFREYCHKRHLQLVEISTLTEAELIDLDPHDRLAYMHELGMSEPGLDRIIKVGYGLLDLITFFTTVGTEVRAWTVLRNTPAQKAAGRIHSDMERGFIRADVIAFDTLIAEGSEQVAKEKGLVRSEGKDYIVRDGDVIRFRFNV